MPQFLTQFFGIGDAAGWKEIKGKRIATARNLSNNKYKEDGSSLLDYIVTVQPAMSLS